MGSRRESRRIQDNRDWGVLICMHLIRVQDLMLNEESLISHIHRRNSARQNLMERAISRVSATAEVAKS
jgi:hypothetical protein